MHRVRDNPLTARVFVNRVWDRLIGQPLVGTTSNFGVLGDRPTHPQLLDDLAVRFMDNGWSLKWLCREIVSSATYQRSSQHLEHCASIDEANQWLWRMNRKRLSVEQWRDSLLASTDGLASSIGGENVDPSSPTASRRTVYAAASRLKLHPMLALFDFPDPNVHSARRSVTTTPSQKLFMMNSPFVIEMANRIANRLGELAYPNDQVERAYQWLFNRSPSDAELDTGVAYLQAGLPSAPDPDSQHEPNENGLGKDERLAQYCHALIVANESLFLD